MTNLEIAESLWQSLKDEQKRYAKQKHFVFPMLGGHTSTFETMYNLLNDDKDAPLFGHVCLELLKHIRYGREYRTIFREAVENFRSQEGVAMPLYTDGVTIEDHLRVIDDFETYIKKIEEDAEEGKWSESVRDLIDGFDLINEKIGSFHDSELLAFDVNIKKQQIDFALHMCNGVDEFVRLRMLGCNEYKIWSWIGDIMYLDFGYFYEEYKRLVFSLDPVGEFYADKMIVLEVRPWNEGDDRKYDYH
ncbi:MAG: hypothetical protein HUK03_02240 [Bacteroidaceae bacterium]|nr:hypothetical protein [Bacteroidaceae bacterium]